MLTDVVRWSAKDCDRQPAPKLPFLRWTISRTTNIGRVHRSRVAVASLPFPGSFGSFRAECRSSCPRERSQAGVRSWPEHGNNFSRIFEKQTRLVRTWSISGDSSRKVKTLARVATDWGWTAVQSLLGCSFSALQGSLTGRTV